MQVSIVFSRDRDTTERMCIGPAGSFNERQSKITSRRAFVEWPNAEMRIRFVASIYRITLFTSAVTGGEYC